MSASRPVAAATDDLSAEGWVLQDSLDGVGVYKREGSYLAVKGGLSYDPALVERAIMDTDHYDSGVGGVQIQYAQLTTPIEGYSSADVRVYAQVLGVGFVHASRNVLKMWVVDAASGGAPDYLEIGWKIFCLPEEKQKIPACSSFADEQINGYLKEYTSAHDFPNNGKWTYTKQADGTYALAQEMLVDLGLMATLGLGPRALAGYINNMCAYIAAHMAEWFGR